MIRDARQRAAQGREIVIFPEGTRRPPGAPPDYKPGFLALYEGLGLPCVPLALNSGLFWPRRSIMRYPGTIVIEMLDPVSAGPAARAGAPADPGAHRDGLRSPDRRRHAPRPTRRRSGASKPRHRSHDPDLRRTFVDKSMFCRLNMLERIAGL